MMHRRLTRERQTIAAMLVAYCRRVHGTRGSMCGRCCSLLDYATIRLERCRFGGEKPVCAKCPVHCYQIRMRDDIKQVMREQGPRMLWRHPILVIRHWIDSWRPPPENPNA